MLSRFFIERPIFAWVIAIGIMLTGILSIRTLPISQYPEIAPPTVTVNARYPGASAQTIEDSVTQIIEQRMKGIDGLRYISSASDSNGSASLTLTFEEGTNPDTAQVQVQNKVAQATPLLPSEVQRLGITVAKVSSSFLLIVALYSTDGRYDQADVSDILASRWQDPLSRISGVGDMQLFGAKYAMRIWLDPGKLQSYTLMPSDIVTAISTQNSQVSVGQLGGTPSVPGTVLNATISAQSKLRTAEQFQNIVIKTQTNGSLVRLKDVARVELGSEDYSFTSRYNGQNSAGLAINLASGANALDTAKQIKAKVEELKKDLPPGLEVAMPFETAPFIEVSITEVVKTLIEAIVLVFLVMLLFLQNWRATLIPTIAVPVVLLGTFAVLSAFGYSINTLTLFGMVLAIGLLVDDAIVVVENVERLIEEEGLSPYDATRKSMEQITGALIGIAMVLSAVFIPMAFFGGSTGIIYRQFSVAIVSAMILSVIVALVLTPSLCANLLKPIDKGHREAKTGFFGWFNRNFNKATAKYEHTLNRMFGRKRRWLGVYAGIIVLMVILFTRMPTAYFPEEDLGSVMNIVQLPTGSTIEKTSEVMKRVEKQYLENDKDAVDSVYSVVGWSFSGSGQNMGMAFVKLKDWSKRSTSTQKASDIAQRAMGTFMGFRDAFAFAIVPPAVPELGMSSGFDLQLQDMGGIGHEKLLEARNMLLGLAGQDPVLTQVRPNGQEDQPELRVTVDNEKAGALGLSIADINATLSTAWGSAYVNDFIDRNRVKSVYMQADAKFRRVPEDLNLWYVRNNQGQMVPFSAFANSKWEFASPRLERFNGVSSFNIQGQAQAGYSSGDAMNAIEKLAKKLPAGVGFSWSGLSFQERMSGDQAPMLYALSLLVVFLCLAALYESWTIPVAVMLVVPLGIVGALIAAGGRGLSNDIYFQVGILTTIGLASKNAILIVEFAKKMVEEGKPLVQSAIHAAHLRLRPILMTSFAFIFGVMPLALSTGAGSGSQRAVGTGVIGGMLSATFLAIFFVPLFFVIVEGWLLRRSHAAPEMLEGTAPMPMALSGSLSGIRERAAGLATEILSRLRAIWVWVRAKLLGGKIPPA